MGQLLHDWSMEEKLLLLRQAYQALPAEGALIFYESIIDDERRTNTFGMLMSLNMLIETQDGFDYTGADCRSWMADIGFQHSCVEPLVGPDSMIVGIKERIHVRPVQLISGLGATSTRGRTRCRRASSMRPRRRSAAGTSPLDFAWRSRSGRWTIPTPAIDYSSCPGA
jgi:hypothetical protein